MTLQLNNLDERTRGFMLEELETESPAVVTFTTAVASQGVAELLHRLAGFMGAERNSSEVLLRFHHSEVRTNRLRPSPDCHCAQTKHWGRGDQRSFLDLAWTTASAGS